MWERYCFDSRNRRKNGTENDDENTLRPGIGRTSSRLEVSETRRLVTNFSVDFDIKNDIVFDIDEEP